MKSNRSLNIVYISLALLAIGFIGHSMDVFGLLPMFVIVIAFFTALVHGFLYLSGRRDSDPFKAYQESAQSKATALEAGLNPSMKREDEIDQ